MNWDTAQRLKPIRVTFFGAAQIRFRQRVGCLLTDSLFITDESHVTMPQFDCMCKNDRLSKEPLIDYGFRLLSAYITPTVYKV